MKHDTSKSAKSMLRELLHTLGGILEVQKGILTVLKQQKPGKVRQFLTMAASAATTLTVVTTLYFVVNWIRSIL
jgi:hypothetical protein